MKQKRRFLRAFKNALYNIFFGGAEYETEDGQSTPFPVAAIFSSIVITVLVLALIFSFIEISALSSDIADMKKEAVLLSAREGKLRDDLNHKYPHAALMEDIEAMGYAKDAGKVYVVEDETDENEEEEEDS